LPKLFSVQFRPFRTRYGSTVAQLELNQDPHKRLQWLADKLLAALDTRDFLAIDESLAEAKSWDPAAFREDPLLEEKAEVLFAVAEDIRAYRWSCIHMRLLRNLVNPRRHVRH
jgi:hypothetical protein